MIATRTPESLTCNSWIGDGSDRFREPLPLPPRLHVVDAAPLPAGVVVVDDGAARALADGASLLPAGVVAVEGQFDRGDAILVRRGDGTNIGLGLSAYASDDVARILGQKSRNIEAILGYRGRNEIIHRDDLVIGG